MKTYFKTIALLQDFFLGLSILTILTLPLVLVFIPTAFSAQSILYLYGISHIAIFLVMIIRPLADIFTTTKYIRPLVILRKGVGVLSAAIIVSFIIAKIIMDPGGYVRSLTTSSYWSLKNLAFYAHIADMSAIILLVTSNNFSKRILGTWWKRIQKLSYVYFYASSLYVLIVLKETVVLYSMLIVTMVTLIAYQKNKKRIS
jgi:DMSO/TMAO reductase YedYZ heme-binding membrane subunit